MPENLRSGISRRLRVLLAVVAILVAVPLGLVAWLFGGPRLHEWHRCRGVSAFDARRWQDPVLSAFPRTVRTSMVDDLVDSRTLIGAARGGVVHLLGEPSRTDYFRDWDLVYWLGPERSPLGIDSEWLVLRLDRAGRVSTVAVVTD